MQQAIQSISLFLGAVEKNKRFDIIICGGGAAGLLLANALSNETAFKHLHIAIIEKGYTFIKGGTGLGLRDTYLEVNL